ncbi:hypothetical protein P4O66_013359 [Electrophorus voltai]|uniref:G protein gamma domain-containing protein n=1 Tax=Electrophorus voltai TaxID=2609070 RepID=A0AAD8Z1L9_9TELE|nr:hypothetical protein P4O66_013359 [Electrophorus voltai]
MANNSTASISQARKAVEQLKMEACMDRIKSQNCVVFIITAYCPDTQSLNPCTSASLTLTYQPPSMWLQVSKAAADLMAYCDAHIREDPLIVPVPASENPFREKKFFCTIL